MTDQSHDHQESNDKSQITTNYQRIERKHISLVEANEAKAIVNDEQLEEFLEAKQELEIPTNKT